MVDKVLGIIGGGQLGRMIALAAAHLGVKSHIFDPDPDSPAFDVASKVFNYEFDNKFDATVLMGLFDYISNPKVLLGKLKRDTNNIILGSFPKLWNIWTLQRMIRYRIRKCPIYFYTKKQIENMLNDLEMNNYELTDNGREFYLKIMLNH